MTDGIAPLLAVTACLEAYLHATLGESRPLSIRDEKLAELARVVFDGGGD